VLNETSKISFLHSFSATEGAPVLVGPQNGPQKATQNGRQNGRGTLSRLLQRASFCSATRGGEQRREQLGRLSFLGSRQRLEPRRLQPDLTVIACRARRQHRAAARRA
jgi:hypothetical protein